MRSNNKCTLAKSSFYTFSPMKTLTGGMIINPKIKEWVENLERGNPLKKNLENLQNTKASSGGGGGKMFSKEAQDDLFSEVNVMRAVRARQQALKQKKTLEMALNAFVDPGAERTRSVTVESIALMAADNYLMAAYKVWEGFPDSERTKSLTQIDEAIKNQLNSMFSVDRDFGVDEATEMLLRQQEQDLLRAKEECQQAAGLSAQLSTFQTDARKFDEQENLLILAQRHIEELQSSLVARQEALESLESFALQMKGESQGSKKEVERVYDMFNKLREEKESQERINATNNLQIVELTKQLKQLPFAEQQIQELQQKLSSSNAINRQFSTKFAELQANFEREFAELQANFERERNARNECEQERSRALFTIKELENKLLLSEQRLGEFKLKLERETLAFQRELEEQVQRDQQENQEINSGILKKLNLEKEQMSAKLASATVQLAQLPVLNDKLQKSQNEVARLTQMVELSSKAITETKGRFEEEEQKYNQALRTLAKAEELNEVMHKRLLVMESYNRKLISSILSVQRWINTNAPQPMSTRGFGMSVVLGIVDRSLGTRLAAPTPEEHVKQLVQYINALKEEIREVLPQREELLGFLSGSAREVSLTTLEEEARAKQPKNQGNKFYVYQ